MGEPAHVPAVADTHEGEIQEALRICGGDAIAALRMTLTANVSLEAQLEGLKKQVSSGYARQSVRKAGKKIPSS